MILNEETQNRLDDITRNLDAYERRYQDRSSYMCVAKLRVAADRVKTLLHAFDAIILTQHSGEGLENLTGVYKLLTDHAQDAIDTVKRRGSNKAKRGLDLLNEIVTCLKSLVSDEVKRLQRELDVQAALRAKSRKPRPVYFVNI